MDKARIELEALITEREGMIAENAYAAVVGHTPTYGDKAFHELADKIRELYEEEKASCYNDTIMGREYKEIAYREVLRVIEKRHVEMKALGNLTKFGEGRLYATREIRTAIEELLGPRRGSLLCTYLSECLYQKQEGIIAED